MWTPGGELRWFGSAARGLDATPEVGIVPIAGVCAAVAAPPSVPVTPDPTCRPAPAPACPSDMVSIAGRYCIDRFESTLVDAATGTLLFRITRRRRACSISPSASGPRRASGLAPSTRALSRYPSSRPSASARRQRLWRPTAPAPGPMAMSRASSRRAPAAAGKRLCILDEFVTACRGEGDTLFPYGDTYEDGVCNVFRDEHPAAILHSNASMGHLDPRLNRVDSRGKPLFQRTGQSFACRSRWGNDAAYDLAGNLDEWGGRGERGLRRRVLRALDAGRVRRAGDGAPVLVPGLLDRCTMLPGCGWWGERGVGGCRRKMRGPAAFHESS